MLRRDPSKLRRQWIPAFHAGCVLRLWLVLWFLPFGFGLCSTSQAQERDEDARVQQLYGEAKTADAKGDLATAVAKYEALISTAPKLAAAYNNLGGLYLRMREFPKAIE